MPEATVTSKGQITIPKAVRESLKLQAGDKVEFIIGEGGQVLITPVKMSVKEVYGILHRPGQSVVSIEEMDSVIKKRASS